MTESLEDKKSRLRRLLENPREEARVPPVEPRGRRAELEPLSSAQQGLWFVSRLEGPNPAYNIPILLRLEGSLDVASLERALSALVHRHEPLRTRFVERGGTVYQALSAPGEVRLEPRRVEPEEMEAEALREARRPFDMAGEELFRARLFAAPGGRFALVLTLHHSVSDAWSTGVLLAELVSLYESCSQRRSPSLPPLAVTYTDYVQWQRGWLESGVLERQLGYWKRELAGLPSQVPVLPDRLPAEPEGRGGTVRFATPRGLLEKLKSLSHDQKCSLFVTLAAALGALLHRRSAQQDLAVGTGVANRRRPELEGLIGYFVNILALRVRVEPEQPFTSLLRATRDTFLQALAHQDAPYHRVVEELRPERGGSPLFQAMLTLQNAPYARRVELPSLTLEVEIPDSGSAKFDLSIAVQEEPDGLQGQIEYRADLFGEETVRRLAEHYVRLLSEVADLPDLPVGRYEILTDAERHLLTGPWSGRDRISTPGRSVPELFDERVRRSPEAAALIAGDQAVTYGELGTRADRLARHLRHLGVLDGAVVGVCLKRGCDMVAALLGVLKAGAAYLPLDPENPPARLRYMLRDAGAELVLTSRVLSEVLPPEMERRIFVDELPGSTETSGEAAGLPAPDETALAYVMYTSGSTGEPKGVAVEHRGITRLVCGPDWIELDEETVTLQHSTVSFDASTFEVWAPLLNGGRLVLLQGEAADVEGMAEQVERGGVNTLWLSAGVLPLWVEPHRRRQLRLRYLLAGGDVVPERCVREIYGLDPRVVIVNGYGPTENTTFSCCFPIPREGGMAGSLPIGRPIRGTSAYVLDGSLQLQPIGGAGELYVGGAGLARGYLNQPRLTAERFVENPFSLDPSERLYRTGDLVRWLASGDLEFLGRADNQVKIRGFRVELEEVEHQLLQLPGVRAGAVVARQDRSGEKGLVGYLVGGEGGVMDTAAQRARLTAKLPEYMVPSLLVVLAELPLTAQGKVDRAALPAPEAGDYLRAGYVAPRTELERRLCEIWEEVLGVGRVGIEDDFFELGGHSLLATRVVSRVRATLGRELPLRLLFDHPKVGALSDRIPELAGRLALPPIEPLADRETLPLSFAQQRLWFIDRLEGGSVHYNVPEAARVRGALDRGALAAAFRTVIVRHEALRTHFRERDGEVRQVVRGDTAFQLVERDLSGLGREEREAEAGRLALQEAWRPFDLGRDLLLRAVLLKLGDRDHLLLLNMHHIASDGWSMGVLARELETLYEAHCAGQPCPLEPLRVQYADYAHWQRQWLRGEVLEEQVGYWRRQLDGLPLVHDLPLDRARPACQGFAGAQHVQRLDGALKERMEAFCRGSGLTLFMFLQAVFAVLLGRYGSAREVVTGSPIAGRTHRDLEPLIGFFVNTLVLRSDLSDNPRFADFVQTGKQVILDAYAHQHAPFEMLVQELRPERSLSQNPLFQILFVLQTAERGASSLGGTPLEWLGSSSGIVKLDLELNVQEQEQGLVFNWLYKRELFDEATVQRMALSFRVLLERALEAPDERLEELPLLAEAERRWLLAEAAGRPAAWPREACVHELFELQAGRSPEAVAVLAEGRQLSFRELNERANRLARYLIAAGMGPEERVGLCVGRSLDMVVSLLGILKAGAAYVPLDPELPEARLGFMVQDSATGLVLTERRLADLGCFASCRTIVLDAPATVAAMSRLETANPPGPGTGPGSLAYLIYTSGATGQPKGVMVEHRQLVHTLAACLDELGWNADDSTLCLAPFAFDIFLFELLCPLLAGGRCLVVPLSPALDLDRVVSLLPEITRLHAVPAVMSQVVGLAERASAPLPHLRTLFVGGDAVSADLLARMRRAFPGAELRVLYGPTETAILATSWGVEGGRAPHGTSLGRPLPNVVVDVCDREGNPVPVGVAGEIRIGGPGVSRGYLGRPDLTAERFTPDPCSAEPGARLYRTGDLARRLPGGTLEFLGRIDHQVKIRGFRIELGEIEAQLLAHPSLREAVVLAREDRPGDRRLVAYVVGRPGSSLKPGPLREHLASKLPEYMVPAAFVELGWLPLTPNGKVDRRALPAPETGGAPRGEHVAPRSELERCLCKIWEELLGVAPVGITDNFFDLGGHSLLATQVVSRMRSALGVELPLRALFEQPTVGDLCERLPELSGDLVLPAIEVRQRRERFPLSYAQQRLWFIDRLEGGSVHYNIPAALAVTGPLHGEAFARALATLVERHESLRTVFREVDGEVCQILLDGSGFRMAEGDLSRLPAPERGREVARLAAEDARRPFDLSRDLLLRATLLKLSGEEHVALFNMHHIASDGWSVGILLREIKLLYEAYCAGGENPLEPLRVQYADYAAWQREWLRGEVLEGQLDYWKHRLAGLPRLHGLPLDRPRPARQGFAGGEVVHRLELAIKGRIEAACRESGVTLFMFLQTAFSALLSCHGVERDVVMGSPIAGRVHRDVEPLIGFFANTLVLRSSLHGDPRFQDLLEVGKQVILEAYAHQHVPFEMLVEELRPERSLSHSPLFQILFVLQNARQDERELGEARIQWMGGSGGIVKFDLELNVFELEDELILSWYYKRELFFPETAERMAARFRNLLEGILERPRRRLSEMTLFSMAERHQILFEWAGSGAGSVPGGTLHGLVEAQVERTPHAEALVAGGERLSYRELDARADRLADRLRRLGVGPEVRVGVLLGRSANLVAALLGVLKTGGGYVPLDPAYPTERLAFYLQDSGAAALVTEAGLRESVPDYRGPVVLAEGSDALPPARPEPRTQRAAGAGPESLAYVIYTSGSTGTPKGVAIEHRSAMSLLDWAARTYSREELAGVLASTSVCFDLSVFEIFVPLSRGGRVVLVENALALPAAAGSGVTLVNTVPSAMSELCRLQALPASLLTVNLAGEPLPRRLAEEIYAGSGVGRVWNLYGPSEDTTYSTAFLVPRGGAQEPAIGRPLPGTRVYLLGPEGALVPSGVPGELCLSGEGVARGYLGAGGLTAERFVPDPFSEVPGRRLYRTGDLARFRPDGSLEYLGRLDHQVKVRGFRIELGEIEAQLRSRAPVQEAAVLAREHRPGERRLVAYVVPAAGADGKTLPGMLRGGLQKVLPEYMIPSLFVLLEEMPLTANGKVDRHALPAPDEESHRTGEPVAPRTELERRLCEIWAELLGLERVGIDESFFALGGHSLLATRLVSQVRLALGRELPLRAVFEHPTIRELCERLPELSGGRVLPPIKVQPDREALPLSFAQQRLWFLDRFEGGSHHYNIAATLRVCGSLDREALAAALRAIVARHEALRTVFVESRGEVRQVVREGVALRIEELDLSSSPAGEREGALLRLAREHARRPFDLGRDLLLRVRLVKLADEEHAMLVCMHHIASDGWSMGVLLRELRVLYAAYRAGGEGPLPLPPLRVQYGDYACWQRGWLLGDVLEEQLGYWRRRLAGAPPVHGLPLDRPRPVRQSFEGGEQVQRLGAGLKERMESLCRRSGTSLFMLLQATFSVLLRRFGSEREVVMGSPVAGRVHQDLEPLIGFFVNMLVLRSEPSPGSSFADLLASVRDSVLEAYVHQHVPFEMLVEELRPERSLSHAPLFQIVLGLQRVEPDAGTLGEARLEWLGGAQGVVKFDLELNVLEHGSRLDLHWLYARDLFDHGTIQRLASGFGVLLEGLLQHPEMEAGGLPLLTEAQRHQVVVEWNATAAVYPRETLAGLFALQAARVPEQVAWEQDGDKVSYGELDRRCNRLARHLARLGVRPGDLVGLFLERCSDVAVGMLGILKSGAAYLPLDPAYPAERLAMMLDDSGACVLLAHETLRGRLPETAARVVWMDTAWSEIEAQSDAAPALGGSAEDLAYVIYTSGSTGRPKGVAVPQRAVVRLVKSADYLQLGDGDRVAQLANLSFDAATFEIWGALLNGATVVGAPRDVVLSPVDLAAFLEEQGISALFLTTALFNQVARQVPAAFGAVRHVLFGGEAVDPAAVRRVLAGGPPARLLHVYGPTENTTFSSWFLVEEVAEDAVTVPIGRPVANTRAHVLDERLQPVPPGVEGELYLGGDGLAREYLNAPDLTRQRFVGSPSLPGERLYRTGDLVRLLPDGNLEFRGRGDHQVKLRGFRIEPGEVEHALLEIPGVAEAVVVLREDLPAGRGLVGYAVPRAGAALSGAALREALKATLPEWMIPAHVVLLEALPLTPNGKVDRPALPLPESTSPAREGYVAPRTELERRLCEIWEELLGAARVGIEDSFFDLGGHSLLATRVVSRVRADLGRELPLRELFENPTVAGLCERLPELGGGWVLPEIEVLPDREGLPLSYAQQRLWFLDRLDGGSIQYNIPAAARVRGRLDREAFARALAAVVERHESLRTVFRERNGKPQQVVQQGAGFQLREEDLSRLEEEARERAVRRLALEDAWKPFDLTRDLLLRATLLTLAEEEHVVLFNMHHIASDGWSVAVLLRELGALYEAFRQGEENPLPPLRIQYGDYSRWQRRWLQGEVLESQLGYWRSQLAGLPLAHELPLDHPRPARQGFEGDVYLQRLDAGLRQRIAASCRRSGATLFMFLQAAFSVLLSRYSHQADVVVGSPIAGRVHRDLEPLIGFFVNTLVLRSDLSGDLRFGEHLEASRRMILDAYAHQHVPFEMLVEELRPERSLSHSPLFQILFVLQNNERVEGRLGESRLEPLEEGSGIVKFDLEITLAEEAGAGLAAYWQSKRELFLPETVERMAGHFQALLACLAEDPGAPVADLPLLSSVEVRQLLVEWNDTGVPAGGGLRLHDLFEAQVEKNAAAVALVDGGRELTYGELAREVHRLAHHLRSLGMGPERIIGVCLDRTAEMVAALLAVLEAGGAYLPLDPAHPRARLERVLADSGAVLVITQESLRERLPWSGPEVVLERDREAVAVCPDWRPDGAALRENLAYVLFTSGSTGTPKGVAVAHRSAVELVLWAGRVFPPEHLSGVLAATSLSFDLSVFEIFVPLSWGGTAILAANALALPDLPARDRVRLVNTVPSAISELVRTGGLPAGVRTVSLAGEPLPRPLADRVWATGTVEALWNLYGPSEDTTYSTFAPVSRESEAVPGIGRPVAATQAYAVDARDRLVPVGVSGELLLGGAGLARGYLGRPELTAERFVPDPFSGEPGARLYRTGDLVRRLPAGDLEFLGRIDHQVKVRGFRIELGEIEAQLRTHPALREAVVMAREDRPGEKRLVAYVVGKPGSSPDPGRLRDHLAMRLPEYMVPAVFVELEWLPLTSSGKVDRRALPAPEVGDFQRGEHVPPRTELERRLCEIWEELLGVEPVGITDSFFDLGGHSLLATQVVSRVRSALGLELPLRALFEHPTVASLCERLPELSGGLSLPAIEVLEERRQLPLSYAQQRLWFIDRLEGQSSQYNIPLAVRVRGALDREALVQALQTIVDRHESLRTVFQEADGEVWQILREEAELVFAEHDLRAAGGEKREREMRRLILEDERRSFDLSRDLLLRASLLRLADEEHVVLINMHHIASDGWSVGVLLRELGVLYEACRAGEEPPLPPLRVQYADYACWQRQWLRGEVLEGQLSYWRRQLAGIPRVHALPLDRPRPAREGFEGGEHVQRLGAVLKGRMEACCRESGVTLFMLLQTVYAALLGCYSHETDIVMGSPIAGRIHRDVEALIGFFVNTLVLRSDTSGDPRFADFLESSKQRILEAYAHQHVPFEMLVEELRPERSLSHSPLFQILFLLRNADAGQAVLGGLPLEPVKESLTVVRFDLELDALELADELVLSWHYKTELFERETVERMASGFRVLLEGLLEPSAAGTLDGLQHRLSELSLLSAAERHQLLREWQGTAAGPESGETLHGLFSAQVARTPEAEALRTPAERLSYRELEARAARLATRLCRAGVGPEVRVGVLLGRSADMVAALLGILKAGGVYVPLDPAYPAERLAFYLQDSGASVLVTEPALQGAVVGFRGPVLLAGEGMAEEAPGGGAGPAGPGALAYVIYTSGSTGRPKGVAIEHRSAVARVRWALAAYRREELAGVLASTSICFDLSVFELFAPLSCGGRVVLVENVLALPAVAEAGVTLVNTVPSAMAELCRMAPLPPSLRTLNLAGEPLPGRLAREVYGSSSVERVWNLYGPSEDTTYSTAGLVSRGDGREPGIGRPLPGTRVYLLGPDRRPVPVGVAGELCLAGAGLARGYPGRGDLTAERFVPDPFSEVPGGRLYRTGDLARFRPDGSLEYLGRLDHQVKLRGFRIELGEIEAQLRARGPVREAVVLAREDVPGEKRLVGYVVPVDGVDRTSLPGVLGRELQKVLPDHMVPPVFVLLDELPRTANGKVNRRALPAPGEEHYRKGEHRAPRTAVERSLCRVWEEVLGLERVGIEDSFFDLGGHSLLVIKLVSKINAGLGLRLGPRHVFENPSVRRLAGLLESLAPEAPAAGWDPLVKVSSDGAAPQLYCIPGAGMLSIALQPLARALSGRAALNVLEARGLDGVSPPQASLGEIVESYGAAIRRHQAQGPYHLLGHSFGGCIAVELARWLEEQGETARIVLLDSVLDAASRDGGPVPDRESALAALASLQEHGILPQDGMESAAPGFVEVFIRQLELQGRYRLNGPVQAPVTLLYAEEGALAGSRREAVEAACARATRGPVQCLPVRGGHFSMLSEERAPGLAETLLAVFFPEAS